MPDEPSQAWFLAPGVHAVAVDRDIVFLNVPADRYDCLADAAKDLLLDHGTRRVIATEGLGKDLAAHGLITRDASGGQAKPIAPLATPRSSLLPHVALRPRWRDAADLARSGLDLAASYRGRSISHLIAAAERSRPAPGAASELALGPSVARFHAWIPYAPVSGKCLLRSFMLLRRLHRDGHTAAWVFAVATWPFRAHCWLQAGETVLDDTVERIRAFTPILVV